MSTTSGSRRKTSSASYRTSSVLQFKSSVLEETASRSRSSSRSRRSSRGLRCSTACGSRALREECPTHAGVLDGVLLVLVSAPAHEGRANGALCRLLAERLGVAPSRVVIVRGRRSREKLVEVDGI